jgi:pimeloyl-ACP methyl ester carboxylesterase
VPAPPELYVDERQAEPGAPLVAIVHGVMDRSTSFGRVAMRLRDLHVIRYDRRGYGRSITTGPADLDRHVADLLEVLDDRPATVVGHSYGAVVALIAAEQHPLVVRSVLAYEPPTPWEPWWPQASDAPPEDPAEEAEAFLRGAVGDRLWERLPARTREARRAEGVALRADIASLQGRAPFDPSRVRVPVLVACGSATTWWHERAARALAMHLPHAEVAVIQGAQHGVHLTHPVELVDLVRRAIALADDQ